MMLVEGVQRNVFHAWVIRTLWGRFAHWYSLWSLEDPENSRVVLSSAWEEWVKATERAALTARQARFSRRESRENLSFSENVRRVTCPGIRRYSPEYGTEI